MLQPRFVISEIDEWLHRGDLCRESFQAFTFVDLLLREALLSTLQSMTYSAIIFLLPTYSIFSQAKLTQQDASTFHPGSYHALSTSASIFTTNILRNTYNYLPNNSNSYTLSTTYHPQLPFPSNHPPPTFNNHNPYSKSRLQRTARSIHRYRE
jgi:hypothetical protein